jgi:hypothetical protein
MIRPQYPEGFRIVEMDGGWYVPEYFDKQQGTWQHFDTNRPPYFVWHKFHKQGARATTGTYPS